MDLTGRSRKPTVYNMPMRVHFWMEQNKMSKKVVFSSLCCCTFELKSSSFETYLMQKMSIIYQAIFFKVFNIFYLLKFGLKIQE